MPVLPLVGSRIVAPGCSDPSFSAASIIAIAARSLIEPVGLWSSSLAHNRTSVVGDRFGSPTSGVPPSESTREAKRAIRTLSEQVEASAAGDRGEDGHRVAVLDLGVQRTGEANVLVVDVDVDEAVQLALLGDEAVLQTRVLAVEVVDERTERGAAALDGLVAAGVGAEDGRDPDLDGHGVRFSSERGMSWVRRHAAGRASERGNARSPPGIPAGGGPPAGSRRELASGGGQEGPSTSVVDDRGR